MTIDHTLSGSAIALDNAAALDLLAHSLRFKTIDILAEVNATLPDGDSPIEVPKLKHWSTDLEDVRSWRLL